MWGKDKPTHAEVAAEELTQIGVNPDQIIVEPGGNTTNAEIRILLEKIKTEGFTSPASLSTKAHQPRIRLDYGKKRKLDIAHINAETVLFNIKEDGEYPFRELVRRIRETELKFIVRESYAIFFDLIGLTPVGERFSDSKWGQKVKAKIDG